MAAQFLLRAKKEAEMHEPVKPERVRVTGKGKVWVTRIQK